MKKYHRIFEKVKRRFFKNELKDYKLFIVEEPPPVRDGKKVFVMGWMDQYKKGIFFKNWAIKENDIRIFYGRCIHELSHALVVDKITYNQNYNHDIVFAKECVKRYKKFFKKDINSMLKRDIWIVNEKEIKAKDAIKLYKLEI